MEKILLNLTNIKNNQEAELKIISKNNNNTLNEKG